MRYHASKDAGIYLNFLSSKLRSKQASSSLPLPFVLGHLCSEERKQPAVQNGDYQSQQIHSLKGNIKLEKF